MLATSYLDELYALLRRGEVDCFVCPLHHLPTQPAEGTVIAGLGSRGLPSHSLLIIKEKIANGQLFGLSDGASVGVPSQLVGQQLLGFKNSLKTTSLPDDPAEILQGLQSEKMDAALVFTADLQATGLDGLGTLRFHPKELVPEPGAGAWAFVCNRDDIPTRRMLQKIHRPEVSAVTNVERKVLDLTGPTAHGSMGVYCERDALGSYHVWAVAASTAGLRRVQLSQSTTYQLAERVVEKLVA